MSLKPLICYLAIMTDAVDDPNASNVVTILSKLRAPTQTTD